MGRLRRLTGARRPLRRWLGSPTGIRHEIAARRADVLASLVMPTVRLLGARKAREMEIVLLYANRGGRSFPQLSARLTAGAFACPW